MRFQANIRIMGAKRSKGSMDNGQAYDSTKLFVEMDLDDSKGDAKGKSAQDYAWGTSENYGKIGHLAFPFDAVGTFDQITTGKMMKTVLVDIKPTAAVKPAGQQ